MANSLLFQDFVDGLTEDIKDHLLNTVGVVTDTLCPEKQKYIGELLVFRQLLSKVEKDMDKDVHNWVAETMAEKYLEKVRRASCSNQDED